MRKHKISMYVSLFVAIILILYMFAPIFSLADNEELNIDLSKVEFEGESLININASSPSKIIGISYVNEKKTISSFNNNAEAIIAYFEGEKAKKVEFENEHFVNKYVKIVGYGDYTVYLRNENGEIQLSYIKIEQKNVSERIEEEKILEKIDDKKVLEKIDEKNVSGNVENQKVPENIEDKNMVVQNGLENKLNVNKSSLFNVTKSSLEPIDLNEIIKDISTYEVKENGIENGISMQSDEKVVEQNSINNNSDKNQGFVEIKEVNKQEITDIKEPDEQNNEPNKQIDFVNENTKENTNENNKVNNTENSEVIDISSISDKSDFKEIKDITKSFKTVETENIKINEDNSAAAKIYPQTGTNNHFILIGIFISLGVSVFSYYKIRN